MKQAFRPELRPKTTHHRATDFKCWPDDLKTEKQWNEHGYKLKEGAEEFKLWANSHCQKLISYYLREDVEKINPEHPDETSTTGATYYKSKVL